MAKQNRDKLRDFQNLGLLGVSHFSNILKASDMVTIVEIVKLVSYFLKTVNEEVYEELQKPMTKEEVESIIGPFKKGRGTSPYGWRTKFYVEFLDIFGDDLLKVVE